MANSPFIMKTVPRRASQRAGRAEAVSGMPDIYEAVAACAVRTRARAINHRINRTLTQSRSSPKWMAPAESKRKTVGGREREVEVQAF